MSKQNLNLKSFLSALGYGLIFTLGLILLISIFIWYFYDVSTSKVAAQFLNTAMWAQVLLSSITLLITIFGLNSIKEIQKQNAFEQNKLESEVYRPFISGKIQMIKKFIHTNEVQKEFTELEERLKAINKSEKLAKIKKLKKELEVLRKKIYFIGLNGQYPLLTEKPTLDHIEFLINEYNYVCKLIEKGVINKEFGTDLGLVNFETIYLKLEQFIKLRQGMSENKYASHFVNYIATIRTKK